MILFAYAIVGLLVLILSMLSRSHRALNFLSIVHAASYFALAAYAWMYTSLPSYYLGNRYFFMDALGIYEALISSALFFFAAIYSKGYVEGSIELGELSRAGVKLFYVALDLLLVFVTYAFFSNNLALFWIFAELTTALSAVLIVVLKAKKNIWAALKYVFIASTSMLFSFIGLIFLFAMTEHALGAGTLNWDALVAHSDALPPKLLLASFAFLFIGFAAKSGAVPFHAWLPTAYSKAPSAISAIMSGCVSSVGLYGILRIYAVAANNSAVLHSVSALLIVFGIASIATAAFSMLTQTNLKKLIAFSSIEHMGFMLVGLGIGTPISIFWTLFHILAHALTKALLFFSAGIMHHQYNGVRIEHIKGAFRMQPLASLCLMIGSVAIIGMPPFGIFLSKLFVLSQAMAASPALLFALLALLFVAAGAFGLFLVRLLSQTADENMNQYVVPAGMNAPLVILVVAIAVLGVLLPGGLEAMLGAIVSDLGLGGI